jgi:hypothetical protein
MADSAVGKVLREAAGWVGYMEKRSDSSLDDFTANAGKGNYTRFNRDYGAWTGQRAQGWAWCAIFVSCVFRYALGKDIFPLFQYCPTGVNNFKKAGQWAASGPRPGDVIFYKDASGTACHVGIVEKADNLRVYTIEGNTSSAAGVEANGECVARKSYDLGYGRILGYGRPGYGAAEAVRSEEDIMFDELIEKYGRDAVKSAVGDLVAARANEDWKVAGSDWLHAAAGLSGVHNQNEPVTFGVLGTVLSKLPK